MDILARDRTLGVANECGDGDFGETKIIGDAGEAVPQDVGFTSQSGVSAKSFFQLCGKFPTALSSPWPGKT